MDDVARRGRIRSRDWSRISHGLYVVGPPEERAALEAWRLILPPGATFTHLTAAQVRGWWLPPLPVGIPVFAAVPHAGGRPRRPGLSACRHPGDFAVVQHEGLPLATPDDTLLACSRDLGLLDVTVLVDAALHAGHTTVESLTATAAARRRGAPLLRQAIRWCDPRSESAWETLLRVLHVSADVGVVAQHTVRDEDGFVARGDLWLTGTTTLHEYDGGHHRTAKQQRLDLARDRRLERAGWTRRGYTAVEVLHQSASIIRDADRSLGREHRSERLRRWHALLAGSMFTPSGRERLRRRLLQRREL